MALQFHLFNGSMQTTAAPVKYATGNNAIRTMLQVKPLINCKLIEWGCSFDGSAAATPGEVECIDTGAVNATGLTACVAADTTQWNSEAAQQNANSTFFTYSTSTTGFTAGTTCTEGSTSAVRNFDIQLIAPTNQYVKQFPLGREPWLNASNYLRIRTTFPSAAVNMYCYIIVEF